MLIWLKTPWPFVPSSRPSVSLRRGHLSVFASHCPFHIVSYFLHSVTKWKGTEIFEFTTILLIIKGQHLEIFFIYWAEVHLWYFMDEWAFLSGCPFWLPFEHVNFTERQVGGVCRYQPAPVLLFDSHNRHWKVADAAKFTSDVAQACTEYRKVVQVRRLRRSLAAAPGERGWGRGLVDVGSQTTGMASKTWWSSTINTVI